MSLSQQWNTIETIYLNITLYRIVIILSIAQNIWTQIKISWSQKAYMVQMCDTLNQKPTEDDYKRLAKTCFSIFIFHGHNYFWVMTSTLKSSNKSALITHNISPFTLQHTAFTKPLLLFSPLNIQKFSPFHFHTHQPWLENWHKISQSFSSTPYLSIFSS